MSMQNMGKFDEVIAILEKNNNNPSRLVPILQQIQDVYGYLPSDVLRFIALQLGLSESKVYGVVTFYAHFSLDPKGRNIIRMCNGTACHVQGGINVLEAIQKRLGLPNGKYTTDDLSFTIEIVSCLGCCGLAPVIVINDEVHGAITPAKAVELVDEIIKSESAKEVNA